MSTYIVVLIIEGNVVWFNDPLRRCGDLQGGFQIFAGSVVWFNEGLLNVVGTLILGFRSLAVVL